MISSAKPFTYLAAAFFSAFACAEDWAHFQDMPDGRGYYETSLIEKSGIFSKEFKIWLRANFTIDENVCGSAPSTTNLNYNSAPDKIIKQALFSQSAHRDYAICTQGLSVKNKTAIYKAQISCDKKTIESIPVEATNYRGDSVPAELQVKSYPGSIGYELISHYCK